MGLKFNGRKLVITLPNSPAWRTREERRGRFRRTRGLEVFREALENSKRERGSNIRKLIMGSDNSLLHTLKRSRESNTSKS